MADNPPPVPPSAQQFDADLGPCLVLRVQPVREADLIVSLLNAQRGRVDAVARGARSSRKRFGGTLQPFCKISMQLGRSRGSLPVLAEAAVIKAWLGQDVDYPRLSLASYAAELALVSTQPGHADPGLMAWLERSWDLCEHLQPGQLRSLKLTMDVGLLRVHGGLPDFTKCARCGLAPVDASWPDWHAGPVCGRCERPSGSRLEPELLTALQQADFTSIAGHRLRLIEERTGQLLSHAVMATLNSARLLQSLIAFDGI